MRQHCVGIARIQDPFRGQAGTPADRDAVAPRVEFCRVVGIRVDRQDHAGFLGLAGPAVIEVETPGAAIDLQGGPGSDRLGDHRLDVDAGFAAPVEAARGRVGQHVHVRRSYRAKDPLGDDIFRLVQRSVNRSYHHLE